MELLCKFHDETSLVLTSVMQVSLNSAKAGAGALAQMVLTRIRQGTLHTYSSELESLSSWYGAPPSFDKFVLVDDIGRLLRVGTPSGRLPALMSRRRNFDLVRGGLYEKEALRIGAQHEELCVGTDSEQTCTTV